MTNPAEAPFQAYQRTTHYGTNARWCRHFPERIPDCLWHTFLAGFNAAGKQTSENGQQVSGDNDFALDSHSAEAAFNCLPDKHRATLERIAEGWVEEFDEELGENVQVPMSAEEAMQIARGAL